MFLIHILFLNIQRLQCIIYCRVLQEHFLEALPTIYALVPKGRLLSILIESISLYSYIINSTYPSTNSNTEVIRHLLIICLLRTNSLSHKVRSILLYSPYLPILYIYIYIKNNYYRLTHNLYVPYIEVFYYCINPFSYEAPKVIQLRTHYVIRSIASPSQHTREVIACPIRYYSYWASACINIILHQFIHHPHHSTITSTYDCSCLNTFSL